MNDDKPKAVKDGGDDHRTAIERYERALEADRQNRIDAYDDLRFLGEDDGQWDRAVREARIKDGRPCFQIDQLSKFCRQVTGDIRQANVGVKVLPVSDEGDATTAEVLEGMVRHIENQSDARHAYTRGADSQVQAGIGHWRVKADYCDEDSFDQELRIVPIRDQLGVIWDPDAILPTRADAQFCFVPVEMTHEAFKAEYPNKVIAPVASSGDGRGNAWAGPDWVRVVEYWRKRPVKKWLKGTSTADLEEVEDEPKDDGKTRKRPVMRHVVEMAVISGQEMLTGWQEWPGKHIPIVPVIGEEVALEKRTVRRGLVRAAKPAQRLLNFMRSAEVELLAMQPKAPYLATAAQVKPFKADWESLNTRSLPVLLYEPDPKAPAPQRIAPPQVSTGLAEAVARATEDMKSITGIYDASLGAKSNETSGRAILAREKQGDTATYHFFDNFSRAVAYTGEIIVDLIPHYYDTARVVRIVRPDGSQDHVAVNDESKPYQPKKGEPTIIDLVKARKYSVVVDSGPAHATKREDMREGLQNLIQAAPNVAPLVLDLYVKAQDWPMAEEISDRLKIMLPPEVQAMEAKEEGEHASEMGEGAPPMPMGPDGQPMPPPGMAPPGMPPGAPMEPPPPDPMQMAAMEQQQADAEHKRQMDAAKIAGELHAKASAAETDHIRVIADLFAKLATVRQTLAATPNAGVDGEIMALVQLTEQQFGIPSAPVTKAPMPPPDMPADMPMEAQDGPAL